MKPVYRARRSAAVVAVVSFTMSAVAAPLPASAELISTDQIIAESHAATDRQRLDAYFSRDDVARQMAVLGVDASETRARIAALSDAEIARIAGQLDTVPAGEGIGALIALAGLVFLVLLLTDFVGATDVFTFVK